MGSDTTGGEIHGHYCGRVPDRRGRGLSSLGRYLPGVLCIVAFALSMLGAQGSASAGIRLALITAHPEGGEYFDLVARDAPGAKLVLYVNNRAEGRARANSSGRASFHEVLLVGTGKVSFSSVVTGQNGRSHQRPTGYVRYFTVSEESVRFLLILPKPAVAPPPEPPPTPPVAPPPASPAPVCTNGTYVNSAGNIVCIPVESPTVTAGATARCVDGTYSFSESRSGTCSHHGGVAEWLY